MNEIWKDVPNYERYYQISNKGRLKTKERVSVQNHIIQERIRKVLFKPNGYAYYNLNVDGKVKNMFIHRLIASAFIDGYNEKLQVDHIDRDRKNNSISNLRVVDSAQNNQNSPARKGCASKYKGVYFDKTNNKWRMNITKEGKKIVKNFKTETEASRCYDIFAKELHGAYAVLNNA